MESNKSPSMRLRTWVERSADAGTWEDWDTAEAQSGLADHGSGRVTAGKGDADDAIEKNYRGEGGEEGREDLDESKTEPLTLPGSSHTLFFTRPVASLSFAFASTIFGISFTSLAMALWNTAKSGSPGNLMNIPANVDVDVRIAQYLAIFIALLTEDGIPTALYLLRIIPPTSFKARFPGKSYKRFALSSFLRIILSYMFLANAYLVIVQSETVSAIFPNILGLQFLAQLDGISFELAKKDVLGTHLRRACTAKLFQTEFEKQKFGRCKRASTFLKCVYILNLLGFLIGLTLVSYRQRSGHYQCDSIKVDFGDIIWKNAVIESAPGETEERVLVFSSFNGIYTTTDYYAGRPVYTEARKTDGKSFDKKLVVPAQIKYDSDLGAWTISHPKIRQSPDQSGWLLRSGQTTEYNLLNAGRVWSIWRGIREYTDDVFFSCNTCSGSADCNSKGNCKDGVCECKSGAGVEYMGTHCEVKVKESCGSITSEVTNMTLSVQSLNEDELFQLYHRPVYNHIEGLPGAKEDAIHWFIYAGLRWLYIGMSPSESNLTIEEVQRDMTNYHSFWSRTHSYQSSGLWMISDPTTGDTPVGVDWYSVEKGDQFGPFGALEPLQKSGSGRSIFRCAGKFVPSMTQAANNTFY